MAFESLSDEFIEGLMSCRKHVENPKTREQVKPGHKQFNYNVQALDESGHQFMLYTRQNTEEGMDDDFSPIFVKKYANLSNIIKSAVNEYIADVKNVSFHSDENTFFYDDKGEKK